ncbi:hypothetical protein TNCT_77741 [Trichonephila clavata]|uniref:Uncharacterized protein n=1 Tax=Trichonephila clavata TaxID=2740835 RepID=A0A8X6HC79_TRICU|nr:hypothetical protein TNCT_77741 [Trichonephila clavata]
MFLIVPDVGRVRVGIKIHEFMDPSYPTRNFLSGWCSGIVKAVCNWHEMGPLMCLDSTMTGQWHVTILSDHLHPPVGCPTDVDNSNRIIRYPTFLQQLPRD